MTPKEKAIELIDKFYFAIPEKGFTGTYLKFREHAKQCALIAVDEIMKEADYQQLQWWEEVKNQIKI